MNMTPQEYTQAMKRLGFTAMTTASQVLGISRNQSWRYSTGESAIPIPTACFIRILLHMQRHKSLLPVDLEDMGMEEEHAAVCRDAVGDDACTAMIPD